MSMLSTYFGEYLFTFLIYGFAAIIIAIIVCRLRIRNAGQKKFWTVRNVMALVFALYLACLLSVTILPRLDFWYMQDGE